MPEDDFSLLGYLLVGHKPKTLSLTSGARAILAPSANPTVNTGKLVHPITSTF